VIIALVHVLFLVRVLVLGRSQVIALRGSYSELQEETY
jgi:hypothetical protein